MSMKPKWRCDGGRAKCILMVSITVSSICASLPDGAAAAAVRSVAKAAPSAFMQCAAETVVGQSVYEIKTRVFTIKGDDQSTLDKANLEWLLFVRKSGNEGRDGGLDGLKIFLGTNPRCAFTMEGGSSGHIINNSRTTAELIDWQPPVATAPPEKLQSQIRSYNLYYQDGAQAGHGYDNALIKLNYRFLLCDDEIQVAYGIDRKSLQHSERYVVRPAGMGNMEYAVPKAEPTAPSSVALNLRVEKKFIGTYVARLRDQVAGETLGMGCFSGQTQKIGLVTALIGPKPTKAQIATFLNSLTLVSVSSGGGADLDFPLINAEFPAPSPPVKKAAPSQPKKRG